MLVKDLVEKCREYYENGDGVSYLDLVDSHPFDFADPIAYYANRANALLLLKQDKEAISACETALHLYPNDPNCYSNMALIYGSLNRYDKAIPYAKQALKMNKNHLDYKLVLASCYFSDHQHAKALPLYLEINDIEYPYYSYDCEIGICYYYLKDELKAHDYLSKAFNQQTLHENDLKVYYQNCIDLGLFTEAYEVIQAMLSYDPTQVLWAVHAELNLLIYHIKDFSTARKRIRQIKRKFPFLQQYCDTLLAYMSFINRRYKNAWNYINTVDHYENFKYEYYSTLGLLYWHDGKYLDAIEAINHIDNLYEYTMLTLALVQSYLNSSQENKAFDTLKLALKFNQFNPSYIKAADLLSETYGFDFNIKNPLKDNNES